MPPVLSFSIHMGRQSSKYLRLTVESMKRNPHVQFVLINVVVDVSPTTGPAVRAVRLSKYAPNFHVVIVSLDEFKRRCNSTLGINLPVTNETAHIKKYAYKMAEYKPTLPLLFPEQFSVRDTTGKGFPFWAYTDLDIIWGNISHFAQLFQGQYDVISTDSVRLMVWFTVFLDIFSIYQCFTSIISSLCRAWQRFIRMKIGREGKPEVYCPPVCVIDMN